MVRGLCIDLKSTRVMRAACVVAIGLCVAMDAAWSCQCIESDTSAEAAFEQYDAVFVGQVVELRLAKSTQPTNTDGREPVDGVEVSLKVLERWKGEMSARAVVVTNPDDGSCGYPFRVGATYLVWARRAQVGQAFTVHLCDRTKPLYTGSVESSEAEADRKVLRGLVPG